MPQFTRVIDCVTARLRQQGHTVRALIAHSLGATASAFVASRGMPIERLVLVAPAASPPEYTRLFAQVFGLSEPTRAAMQRRIEAREGILMPQFEPAMVGSQIRVPTLVAHDQHDSINRFADGQAYADAVPGARLMRTEGLGHRKILQDSRVINQIVAFAV